MFDGKMSAGGREVGIIGKFFGLIVHFFAMSNCHDEYHEFLILNFTNNAVIAYPVAP